MSCRAVSLRVNDFYECMAIKPRGVDIYRAVLRDGIMTFEAFEAWFAINTIAATREKGTDSSLPFASTI
jgi:hypothetical protein